MGLANDIKSSDLTALHLTHGAELEVLASYKISLKHINGELAEAYRKYSTNGKTLTMAEISKYGRLAKLEDAIMAEIKAMTGETIRSTDRAIKDIFTDQYFRMGHILEMGMQSKLGFAVLDTAAVEKAVLNPLDLVTWPGRTKGNVQNMTRTLRGKLSSGIIEGKGYAEMARDIKKTMDIGATKAKAIVQTEMHRCQVAGRLAGIDKAEKAADDLGVKVERVWDATLDGKTRPDHQAADGQIADKDKKFTVGGIRTSGPGQSGSAAQDCNCRCGVRTLIDGETPDERMARNEKGKSVRVPYQTYEEWAEGKGVKPPKTKKEKNEREKAHQ